MDVQRGERELIPQWEVPSLGYLLHINVLCYYSNKTLVSWPNMIATDTSIYFAQLEKALNMAEICEEIMAKPN